MAVNRPANRNMRRRYQRLQYDDFKFFKSRTSPARFEFEREVVAVLNNIQFSVSSFKKTLFRCLKHAGGKDILQNILAKPQHLVQLLLVNSAGGQYNFYSNEEKTVLHFAAKYGWVDIVESLLKLGSDPNAKDINGKTPIIHATNNQYKEIVDLLVKYSANIFCHTQHYTLLHSAAGTGWVDFVQHLLNRGVDINAKNKFGQTALHVAILKYKKDIVTLLLNSGADTAYGHLNRGGSVLHFAVEKNRPGIVKLLVEKGFDINDTGFQGLSPLDLACREQNADIIEYLVNEGNRINGSNETPLKYVVKNHFDLDVMKDFVERYGYDSNFLNDYYGEENLVPVPRDVFQDAQVCTEAIVKKFNETDLESLYDTPSNVGILPSVEDLMIKSEDIIQDMKESVQHEINTKEHCDLRRPQVIVLRMLAANSYVDYYKGLKRSADTEEPQPSCSRIATAEDFMMIYVCIIFYLNDQGSKHMVFFLQNLCQKYCFDSKFCCFISNPWYFLTKFREVSVFFIIKFCERSGFHLWKFVREEGSVGIKWITFTNFFALFRTRKVVKL